MLIDENRTQQNETKPDELQDTADSTQPLKPKLILQWSTSVKGQNPAYVGCKIVHPNGAVGEIVEGASNMSFGGKKVARIGDKVRCPGHEGVILQGTATVSLGKKPIARIGDKTSCGGVIVEGFPTITVLDQTKTALGESNREIRFKLTRSPHSEESGYGGMPYKLFIDGGEVGKGVTDDDGVLILLMEDEKQKQIKEYEIRFANGKTYFLSIVDAFEDNSDKDKIAIQGFHIYEELGVKQAKSYNEIVSGKRK